MRMRTDLDPDPQHCPQNGLCFYNMVGVTGSHVSYCTILSLLSHFLPYVSCHLIYYNIFAVTSYITIYYLLPHILQYVCCCLIHILQYIRCYLIS